MGSTVSMKQVQFHTTPRTLVGCVVQRLLARHWFPPAGVPEFFSTDHQNKGFGNFTIPGADTSKVYGLDKTIAVKASLFFDSRTEFLQKARPNLQSSRYLATSVPPLLHSHLHLPLPPPLTLAPCQLPSASPL
ncbi:unnamed protein product [Pleuronectes platessa]|uniref:Uncharacterized protein n=1 Tax=Pleuronectes platessa TaxID=8262 RepID=A0A9N7TJF1_PLEPL|nr:unnamed protein product [Pleuronectes platessa]